jgi:hypothetical protein
VERVYLEGIVMGLCIGLLALLLDAWIGDRSWRMRITGLVLVGGALCVLQYAVARIGKR